MQQSVDGDQANVDAGLLTIFLNHLKEELSEPEIVSPYKKYFGLGERQLCAAAAIVAFLFVPLHDYCLSFFFTVNLHNFLKRIKKNTTNVLVWLESN